MHVYKHAQPALLYLVPACLGVPLFLALVRGDIKSMFQYEDHPNLEEKKTKKSSCPSSVSLILQILVSKPSVTICCLMIDTLPATLLSSVHMFFSPSQAEYIWYF